MVSNQSRTFFGMPFENDSRGNPLRLPHVYGLRIRRQSQTLNNSRGNPLRLPNHNLVNGSLAEPWQILVILIHCNTHFHTVRSNVFIFS